MESENANGWVTADQSPRLTAIAYYAKAIALGMFGGIIMLIGGGAFLVGTSTRSEGFAAVGIIAGGVIALVAWVIAWDNYTTANRYMKSDS